MLAYPNDLFNMSGPEEVSQRQELGLVLDSEVLQELDISSQMKHQLLELSQGCEPSKLHNPKMGSCVNLNGIAGKDVIAYLQASGSPFSKNVHM